MLTVNQIYKDLIALTKTALQSQGLNWQVIQTYQQTMGNFKPPFVMLHRLTTSNYGFQFGKDKTVTQNGVHIPKHTENQIEIQTYQIEACYRRSPKETVATITGADVVRVIARWFMSDAGIQAVREKGYNILRISEVAEEYYTEVNDIYQVNPHFKMQLVALQTDETNANKINGFIGNIIEVEQLKNRQQGGQ